MATEVRPFRLSSWGDMRGDIISDFEKWELDVNARDTRLHRGINNPASSAAAVGFGSIYDYHVIGYSTFSKQSIASTVYEACNGHEWYDGQVLKFYYFEVTQTRAGRDAGDPPTYTKKDYTHTFSTSSFVGHNTAYGTYFPGNPRPDPTPGYYALERIVSLQNESIWTGPGANHFVSYKTHMRAEQADEAHPDGTRNYLDVINVNLPPNGFFQPPGE
jgi:hypothetical protein